MKTKNILFGLLFVLGFGASSCEDKSDDNLTETKVYISKSGDISVNVYNVGEDVTYKIGAYKSGAFNNSATAELTVLSDAELALYNQTNSTDYKAIPATCYTIDGSKLAFSKEEKNAYITINFKPESILSIPDYKTSNYVLPIQLSDASVTINEDKKYSFIKPNVLEPTIYLAKTGFSNTVIDDGGEATIELDLPLALDFENKWNINCSLQANQDLLDSYNTAQGTSYKLLPVQAYTIDPNPVTIASGKKGATVKIQINRDKLDYGDYILPVQLASVSKFNIASDSDNCLFGVSYQAKKLSKLTWKVVDFSSEEASGEGANGFASLILDGNTSTFWHSQWANGTGQLPHHLTIDMQKEVTVVQVDLTRRTNNTDTKAGNFYISSDKSNWTKVGSFLMAKTNDAQPFAVTKSKGRYLKIEITESNRAPFANMAEVDVRGIE